MTRVVVLGAGKIGVAIARMLQGAGDYQVTLCDGSASALARLDLAGVTTKSLDCADETALASAMADQSVVISALPFFLNPRVAAVARQNRCHYFDLTEDVETAQAVREIALGADQVFIPQCGLAPGFVSIAAHSLVQQFDEPYDVKLRVGALPQFPDNGLKYNLTWSTDGLINEYCNPCDAIVDGQHFQLVPLDGLEHFSLDGVDYEAFSTSGGIGSLCETLLGKVRNLNYKTVRYPGHAEIMKVLCKDLRLGERRDIFRDIVEKGIPVTRQDVVLLFITVNGMRQGNYEQQSFAKKIYADRDAGQKGGGYSAIQLTTAAGICAVVDLHQRGKIPQAGFQRPESVTLEDFLANRFGKIYQ